MEVLIKMISKIKEKRFYLGLTQYDLAFKTKIPQPTISLMERGYVKPKEEQKEVIAKILKCCTNEIFGDERNGNDVT